MIMDHPGHLEALAAHPTDDNDLVLLVRRPLPQDKNRGPDFVVKIFATRADANSVRDQDVAC